MVGTNWREDYPNSSSRIFHPLLDLRNEFIFGLTIIQNLPHKLKIFDDVEFFGIFPSNIV